MYRHVLYEQVMILGPLDISIGGYRKRVCLKIADLGEPGFRHIYAYAAIITLREIYAAIIR